MAFDLDPTYKQVPERIADFKEKHPDGCLRPVDPARPFWFEERDGQTFIVYAAAAYRSPDDTLPGIGLAWEPFPGKTPYTKQSELQNAETSAWGRAIVAVLASESKSVASAEDVRNRQAAQEPEPEQGWYGWVDETTARTVHSAMADRIAAASDHVKTALRDFRHENEMSWPMSQAKWETFVARAEGLLTADPSGETPVIVSPDAPSPIPSHGDGDTAGAAFAAPAVAAAPAEPSVEEKRLQGRLDRLPTTLRHAAEDELTEANFMPGGMIACTVEQVKAVSKVLDRFEEDANGAPGLQARAAARAKGTAA